MLVLALEHLHARGHALQPPVNVAVEEGAHGRGEVVHGPRLRHALLRLLRLLLRLLVPRSLREVLADEEAARVQALQTVVGAHLQTQ